MCAVDSAEIWYGAKSPIVAGQQVAAEIGLPADKVTLHVVRTGGSFGHRLFFDPALEAALISKSLRRPIKLMWTRNDDMRHGRMRPASHHKVRATYLLGNVLTYEHRHATLPVDFSHGLGDALTAAGFDLLSAGATQTVFALTQNVPYDFGVATQTLTDVPLAFPTGSWRSIYSGQTATVNEIMVDEIARALHADPVAFRRKKLGAGANARGAQPGRERRPVGPGYAGGHGARRGNSRGVQVCGRVPRRDRLPRPDCASGDEGRMRRRRRSRGQPAWTRSPGTRRVDRRPVDDPARGFAHRQRRGSGRQLLRLPLRAMADSPTDISVVVMPPTGEPGGAGELGFPAAAAAVANAYARATGTTPFSFPISGGS